MKSALFVDFDNVYSGLRRLDPAVAERFAFQPINWIRWLTDSLAPPPHAPEGAKRRLLVRRCYLNPQAYQRFRPAFNLAGFELRMAAVPYQIVGFQAALTATSGVLR